MLSWWLVPGIWWPIDSPPSRLIAWLPILASSCRFRGFQKAVPYVRWIPGILSIARTQENGESTFQPAGLFHPSTIYITEKRRMYKKIQKFNEKFM